MAAHPRRRLGRIAKLLATAPPKKKKTALDKFAEELAYAGAIASLQMNEPEHPDGKRYGILGGRNPNGPNNPVAQAAAGAVLVTTAVLAASGKFEDLLRTAIQKKIPLVLKGTMKLSEEAAEYLARKWGPKLADALRANGTIGPYSVMRKFTEGQGGAWQAHHILEKKMMIRFGLGNADNVPAVILTEARHKALTAELAIETKKVLTLNDLWKAYKKVYADHPEWLKAIESYFGEGK